MIGIDGKLLSQQPQVKTLTIVLQKLQKFTSKIFHRKTCNLILWIPLQYFVQFCLRKHIFISNLGQAPRNLHFWYILAF